MRNKNIFFVISYFQLNSIKCLFTKQNNADNKKKNDLVQHEIYNYSKIYSTIPNKDQWNSFKINLKQYRCTNFAIKRTR